MIITPSNLFDTVFKIITFGSLVSLWWDGEKSVPYIVIEGEESKSVIYSAAMLLNGDFQYTPVMRFGFQDGLIIEPNTRVNITSIDNGATLGLYFFPENGCSIQMDRLIVTDRETGDGLFITFGLHVLGFEEKNLMLRYTVEEIIMPDDDDTESVGV